MKLKKAKKFESSLVVILEFIRVAAKTNPKATTEILQKMGVDEKIFADCVNRMVKLALKNAEAVGEHISDVLTALRKKSSKATEITADEDSSDDYEDEDEEGTADE